MQVYLHDLFFKIMITKIVHISDTHGDPFHSKVVIPECDILIHSGDFSEWRGTIRDLTLFLTWFEKQPAKVKIFISGNHDCVMDKQWCNNRPDTISQILARQQYLDAMSMIEKYKVKYLCNNEYIYQGIKIWGSPYSPSFGNDWAFNADRGEKIMKQWSKIPSDVDILITHSPVYGIQDRIEDKYMREGENDNHKGCKDLLDVIKKRLTKLKLHCCGHIHDEVGVVLRRVSNTRRVLFSNGAVINNDAQQLITNPLIINL